MIYKKMFFSKYKVWKILVFCSFLFLAQTTLAKTATLYFDTALSTINKGDIFVVTLKISSPEDIINAGEGKILFDSNKLKVEDLSSGNSIFNVWLKEPEFSNKKGEINFIGGHGGGWQGEGELFKIIFSATNEGEAELSFGDDLALYLNDGLGTELNPWQQPAKFMIQGRPQDVLPKDEWSEILGNDSIPPEEFTIEIG